MGRKRGERRKKKGIQIKYKLLLAIYGTIAPLIIVVSIYIYITNQRSVMNSMIALNTNLVEVADENVGYLNNDIIDISTYIGVNNQVRKLLWMKKEEVDAIPLVWERNAPMGFVRDTLSVKSHIRTLILFPENGASPFYVSGDMTVHNTNFNEIRETETYHNTVAAQGNPVYSLEKSGQAGLYIANRTDKVVVSRMIFDLSKKNKMGYICVGMDVEEYSRICKSILQSGNEAAFLYGDTGMFLTSAGASNPEAQAYIENELATRKHAQSGYVQHNGSHIFFSENSGGFAVYYVVPTYNLMAQLSTVLLLPIFLLIGMILLLIPLSMFASNLITRPLLRLHESMIKFKSGDFDQQVVVESSDEIGELTGVFNAMVSEIKELIDKNYIMVLNERQSELNALQAQINPHFLYNTLDSLYWRAQNAGHEELAEDIYMLSQLFRLVLSRGEEAVPLSQEVELIQSYLHIQKMRFGKKLEYNIDVDQDIMNVRIPKLILQPFVENAIVHGLESTGENGQLFLRAERDGVRIRFTIADNGVGISGEKLAELLKGEEDVSYSSERLGHYAIRNVQQRLALKYEDYALDIQSEQGKGTVVTIIIPGG